MPCVYCGKPISLVRRLADPDFCSDEHRQRYHELARLALKRLEETREHLEALPRQRRSRRSAVELHPAPAPPIAEALEERMAAAPGAGQSSFAGEFAAAYALCLPGTPTPQAPAPRTGVHAPIPVRGVFEVAEQPRLAVAVEVASLPRAARVAPAGLRPALRALQRPGLFLLPIEAPHSLAPPGGRARGPVSEGFTAAFSGLRLPPLPALQARLPRLPSSAAAAAVQMAWDSPIPPEPMGGLQPAAVAVTDPGKPLPPAPWDITFPGSPVWRLRPVAFELFSTVAPPVMSEALPLSAPKPAVGAGQVVAVPAPEWRPQGRSLPRLDRRAAGAALGWATPIAGRMPAGLAGPKWGKPQPAAPPGLRLGGQYLIGWVAASQRRGLGHGDPVPLVPGGSQDVVTGLRESLVPAYRIAVWAFTRAPGLRHATMPPEGALLVPGPPRPAVQAWARSIAIEQPSMAGVSLISPAWSPQLTAQWWPVATEPLRPTEVSPLELEPAGVAAAPAQPVHVDLLAPRSRLPEELHPRALVAWAGRAPQLDSRAAFSIPLVPSGRARQATPQWDRAPQVLAPAARRPAPPQLPAPLFSAAGWTAEGWTSASPGPAPGVHPVLLWQTVGGPSLSFHTVRFEPWRPVWTPPGYRAVKPRVSPVAGREVACAVSVAIEAPPVAPPPPCDVAARGPLLGAAPKALSPPALRDTMAGWSRTTATSAPVEPPARTTLPKGISGTAEAGLLVAPPAAAESRPLDAPKWPSLYEQRPLALSSLALPAGAGIPGWVTDLSWPHACPIGPMSRDLVPVPLNQPREAPLGPSLSLPALPITPIGHRFERLPPEPQFMPALDVARLWRRILRPLIVPLAAVVLVALAGSLLWNAVRESVRERGAVVLDEDFSSGMHRWTAGVADWSRNPAGFVQVGSLALLGPSLRLTDYRLQFMGEIEQQSLAWVFRGQDPDNYYAMRIAVLKPGPLPSLALSHSRIILGQEMALGQVPLRVTLYNNAPFRVQMRIRGTDFTTFVNNQQVDFWSDDRLRSGGVGFFCDKGSRARLYWIKVTHQDDLVGKLCSYLAPTDLSKNGGWKR